MREIIIDCAGIGSRQAFHQILAGKLDFPDWYGNNLDALHDQLTGISRDTRLILSNWDAAAPFGAGFRKVLLDAARENPRLRIIFA